MNSALGLAELLLVLLAVMGWGAYELWSLRRDRRPTVDQKPGGREERQASAWEQYKGAKGGGKR